IPGRKRVLGLNLGSSAVFSEVKRSVGSRQECRLPVSNCRSVSSCMPLRRQTGKLSAILPRDTFRFGRKRLESEGMTDEPQRTHLLFSRTYAGCIGWLLQQAIGPGIQESRDRAGQNPGKGPGSGGIEGGERCRSERGWAFSVPLGRRASLPPVLEDGH